MKEYEEGKTGVKKIWGAPAACIESKFVSDRWLGHRHRFLLFYHKFLPGFFTFSLR
jgi:hypothetical protein